MRIVIPGDDPPQIQGSPHLERLEPYGEVVLYTDRPDGDEEKLARAGDADVLLNSRGIVKWPAPLLRRMARLKMIAVCGIGTDAIDVEAARERGVVVCNVGGCTASVVAEHALALLLAAARQAWYATDQLKRGGWPQRYNVYLGGKTLGLVGAGNIAARMAVLGRALGMDVIAWTYRPSPERARQLGVRFVALDELLRTSDAVSVHVKLTEQSRGLIGRREIGLMKPGALLVNTARGPVVDTAALVEALRSGGLAGAGLDVYDVEPLPADSPLVACDNVVLTPHNADLTAEGMELLNSTAVDNIIAFCEGRPQNRVV